MVDSVNKFALAYCALSGDSFCSSTKVTFGIFRRNMLDRVSIGESSFYYYTFDCIFFFIIITDSLCLDQLPSHTSSSVSGWCLSQ